MVSLWFQAMPNQSNQVILCSGTHQSRPGLVFFHDSAIVRLAEARQLLLQESATYYLPSPSSERGGDAVVFKLANGGQLRRSRESRLSYCVLCSTRADHRVLPAGKDVSEYVVLFVTQRLLPLGGEGRTLGRGCAYAAVVKLAEILRSSRTFIAKRKKLLILQFAHHL
jgi:hypothetical protein